MRYLAILFLCLFGGSAYAAEKTVEGLKLQMVAMAKELDTEENSKIRDFFGKYATKDDLHKMGELDGEMIEMFKARKRSFLLQALSTAGKLQPEVEGNVFKFRLTDLVGNGPSEMVFVYDMKSKLFKLSNRDPREEKEDPIPSIPGA